MDNVKIAQLEERIRLLTSRGSHNDKLVAKLKREIRKLQKEN